ncbi:MAG: DNA polymerase III subunit alpha [Firmicutes bacterium]|nr:DNA polymerase III subunit alpha [Bacillota bacterium]
MELGAAVLHAHSWFSLLQGVVSPQRLAETAATRGIQSMALTDTDGLWGIYPFAQQAVRCGIQPIAGLQWRVHTLLGVDRVLLLALNETGYRTLLSITSRSWKQDPQCPVGEAVWIAGAAGVVLLIGGRGTVLFETVARGSMEVARVTLDQWRACAPQGGLFGELNPAYGAGEQRRVRRWAAFCQEAGIPLVATADATLLRRDELQVSRALAAIDSPAENAMDGYPRIVPGGLPHPQAMQRLFAERPDALRNAVALAEQADWQLPHHAVRMPRFASSPAEEASLLREACAQGVQARYGLQPPEQVTQRLNYELSIIVQMGFCGYFLIVADVIHFCRQAGIAVGPGRGSAAGSLVAYVLGITQIDPLAYNLLFERFLNPERVSLPDIDVDLSDRRRDEVIAYIQQRYGPEKVAQIVTFGTFGARQALRDAGRVLHLPSQAIDAGAGRIPRRSGVSLHGLLQSQGGLREALLRLGGQSWIDLALQLEGLPRHLSVHAAGIVLAPMPLVEETPLWWTPDGRQVTQYPMEVLEQLGLLKIDFLGLRTLSLIEDCIAEVSRTMGTRIVPEHFPTDDEATYALIAEGDTDGVFQLESEGMRQFLRQLKPVSLADLVAALALFRPGPSEQIDRFLRVRQGVESPHYPHPALEPILRETGGVLVYQEQVMQIAAQMAGFRMGEADLLRRAIGHKDAAALAQQAERFQNGARAQGIPEAQIQAIWELILRFANYGFNKAHATAYAQLSYQTAYLKAHWPAAFYAALCNSFARDKGRLQQYLTRVLRLGLPLFPPRAKSGAVHFRVEGEGIRYGLAAIKGVGRQQAEAVVAAAAESADFPAFLRAAAGQGVSAHTIEILIKSGSLDDFGDRQTLLDSLLLSYHEASLEAQEERGGQLSLFEPPQLPKLPSSSDHSRPIDLREETVLLGFPFSALQLVLTVHGSDVRTQKQLQTMLATHPGHMPVLLRRGEEPAEGALPTRVGEVSLSGELWEMLKQLYGSDGVQLQIGRGR